MGATASPVTGDEPPAERGELITWLWQQVDRVLRPLLAGERDFALLDFPNHRNVGDCAIWLGERAYLRALGISRLRYVCDISTYAPDHLRQCIGRGTILLHGGGNFGDLWPPYQALRERVIAAFPDNRIIQLPQTICFQSADACARARTVFNRHRNLILLVRDRRSLAIAQREFNATSLLCPDMAVCLGALHRRVPAAERIVWLARSDHEAATTLVATEVSGVTRVTWPPDPPTPLMLASRLSRKLPVAARPLRWLRRPLSAAYDAFARERVARGLRLLSRGTTVVTDRLHGHLLCLLLDIPHFLVDTRFGKVRDFFDTWTYRCGLSRWCSDHAEALRLATRERGRAA
jgi:pyruvyl transferase EpsO